MRPIVQVPLTPVRFLYRAVDLYGGKIGVVSGARQFTYAEFGERCERLASALTAGGVQPGDRIACLSFNTHQLLEAYYGVAMARAIVLPLNARLAPPELIGILNHAEARMLLYEKDFAPTVERLRPSCVGIEEFISFDEPVSAFGRTYEQLLASGRPGCVDFTAVDENSVAELFYTSGTSGAPKGVMLTHRALYLHAFSLMFLYQDRDRTVQLHTIPLFHANGWGHPQCATMLGATQVMVRRFDPDEVFRLIQEHRATAMSLVPTMANALLNATRDRFDLSSMRHIMLGGAASSPELIDRLEKAFRCRCEASYGLTETAPVLTTATMKGTLQPDSPAERLRRLSMTGWPLPGVELRVVDSQMNDVPRDMRSVGEIIARGDYIMSGYYKDPHSTDAVMADGWLRTGDMAVWDEEGYVHIVDRKKDIIISGGENISSVEVENAIGAHPEVYECAVFAAPDEKWGEVPVAVVHLKPGCSLTAEALVTFLKERIAGFKVPRRIEFTDSPLPKTGSGKIRKSELRESHRTGA